MNREDKERSIPEDSFIDDTSREWVAHTKEDEHGLNVKQHLLICHIAIIAGTFPDKLFPTLKDKGSQYHHERSLASMDVDVDAFYKSLSSIEYSYLEVPDEDGKSFTIERKKYIDSELIESVTPFVLRWYPFAAFFIQTLNTSPYRLEEKHYYWVYREARDAYPQGLKHFFDHNCPHLNYNTFKSIHRRHCKANIESDMRKYITPYLRECFPDAVKEN